jgi:hypothetical protein
MVSAMATFTVKKAGNAFDLALKVPDRLLAIEAKGSWGTGYPAKQQALRSSAVVLTVAAWQAFVEDIARAVLDGTKGKAAGSAAILAALADASLANALGSFNTPNTQNVDKLFSGVGFALGPGWTVTVAGTSLSAIHASDVNNAWMQVRHSIAHGIAFHKNSKLETLRKLGHVNSRVVTGKKAGKGSGIALTSSDAVGCRALFFEMRSVVATRAAQHLASL